MKKKLVILLGPDIRNKGGMSASEEVLLKNWRSTKYSIELIETHKDGNSYTKITTFLRGLFTFLSSLVHKHPTIIYIFFSVYASFYRKAIFILLSKLFHKKIVIHARGGELGDFFKNSNSLAKKIIIIILGLADARLVLGNREKEVMDSITGQEDAIIIHNAIECTQKISYKKTFTPIISTMGRISTKKGTFDLLKAVPSILEEFPHTEFWICGEGEQITDTELVKEILQKYQIENNVKLLGWVDGNKKDMVYRKSWIFTLPSYYEGMSRSILEAMAYGLPIVTTNINGTIDLIDDEITGLLISPGDHKLLASKIIGLLKNKEYRIKLGKAARRKVVKQFNIKTTTAKLEKVFDNVMEIR